ncbi:MAG TPA: alpha/beta fold hydrolase [Rhodocyclaceae bacterium]
MKRWLAALALACGLISAPHAEPAVEGSAPAPAAQLGVVVLHGKWDNPQGHIVGLVRQLKAAGFKVAVPEMAWSLRRGYDTDLAGVERDIDAAIDGLRKAGAQRIVLAGHSLGSAGAVRYAGRHVVDGLVVLAPGHFPEGKSFREKTGESLARAQALIAAGKGDEVDSFVDPNTGGRLKRLALPARIYAEFMDPEGPMNYANNSAAVKPGIPVLWIAGAGEDEGPKRSGYAAYQRLPEAPPPRYLEISGVHLDIPDAAAGVVIEWLRETFGAN